MAVSFLYHITLICGVLQLHVYASNIYYLQTNVLLKINGRSFTDFRKHFLKLSYPKRILNYSSGLLT